MASLNRCCGGIVPNYFVRGLFGVAVLCALPLSCLSSVADTQDIAGHLKPFGYQRVADYPIDDVLDPYSLRPEEFYTRYVETRRPVVFRGAAKHFKAFKEWTKKNLIEKYGKVELRIEPRKDGSGGNPIGALGFGRDTMENFVVNQERSDNYVVSELPTQMYGDIELLPSMSCGRIRTKVSEINLWMSGGGTRSRLHRDAFNAINCQISGTKDWIMVPPNQTDNVYFEASSEWELGGLSPVNTDSVDLNKYPRIRDVPWGISTIEAGDCIYIPGGHYHQVRSYGFVNVAVSVLFSRLEMPYALGFDPAECAGKEAQFVPLSEEPEIFWQYPGTGMMTMGCIDDNALVCMMFTRSKGKPLSKKVFFDRHDPPLPLHNSMSLKQAWKLLDTDEDGMVTRADIVNMSRDAYRELSRVTEPDKVYSNSYDLEYASLDYDLIRAVLRQAFKQHGKLNRKSLVGVYTQVIGGSPYFGNKLFDRLDTKKKGVVKWKSLKHSQILENALEPYLEQEEDAGENHVADGDGADAMDGSEEGGGDLRMDPDSMMQRIMGQTEEDIENNAALSDSEREQAMEDYQEKMSRINDVLGLEDKDEEDGQNDEQEEDRMGEVYRNHMARVNEEKEEEDRLPHVDEPDQEELEEIVGEDRTAKTEL